MRRLMFLVTVCFASVGVDLFLVSNCAFCQTAAISDVVCKVDNVVKQPVNQTVQYASFADLFYQSKVTLTNNTTAPQTFHVEWKLTSATQSTGNSWSPTLAPAATDDDTSSEFKGDANLDWWGTTTASVVFVPEPPVIMVILASNAVKFEDTNPNDDPPGGGPGL